MKKKLGYIVLAVSGSIYILYNFTVTSYIMYLIPERTLVIRETAVAEISAFIPIAILFIGLMKISQKREEIFNRLSFKSLAVHLLILILFIGVHSFWQVFSNSIFMSETSYSSDRIIVDAMAFLNMRIMVYIITVGLIIGVKRVEEKESYELKESELKLRLERAKIRKFELKLNPDIIYPTLEYVKENAEKNPEISSQLILNLSKQMRILIDHLSEESIPLNEDILFFEHYFQSLNIRQGRSMKIDVKVDEKHVDMKIPSLVLLVPLFEKLFLGVYSKYTEKTETVTYSSGHTRPDTVELSIEMYPVENIPELKKALKEDEHLKTIQDLLKYYDEKSSLEAMLAINTLAIHLSIPFVCTPGENYA